MSAKIVKEPVVNGDDALAYLISVLLSLLLHLLPSGCGVVIVLAITLVYLALLFEK